MSSRRSAPPLLAKGTLVAGRYRIDECIAWGGMGVVYACEHVELGRRLALKFLRPDLASDGEAATRFLDEARMAANLKSEHVVHVVDFGHHDGLPYMVLEYLEGVDLWAVVDERGVLPVREAVDYLVQACAGLAEVHAAGIVHRDLKPENLFIARCPDGKPCIKILDFGISKRVSDGRRLTQPKKGVGSPLYMSPEQMRAQDVDARADVWALGNVLYEVLTGELPFDAESVAEICSRVLRAPPVPPSVLRSDIPVELERVILGCLDKDRNRRIADVAELACALAPFGSPAAREVAREAARILGKNPSAPPRSRRIQRARRPARPRGAWIAVAALAAASVTAAGIEPKDSQLADIVDLIPPERALQSWIVEPELRFANARALPEREDEKRTRHVSSRPLRRAMVANIAPDEPVVIPADAAATVQCPVPLPAEPEEGLPPEPPTAADLPVVPLRPITGAWRI